MKIVREELWKRPSRPGMIVVTTNATIKSNGALVMGRGAALQARNKIPGIDQECGRAITRAGSKYGFLVIREPTDEKTGFGIFQVKDHFKAKADLELIRYSTSRLWYYTGTHPVIQVRMNFPGIGFGHLARKDVEPLLAELPDCVTICYR